MTGAVQGNLFGVPTVAALFVDRAGLYSRRCGVDPWDEARDARRYTGSDPVVAHPPCERWVNLAAVNWQRYSRQLPAWYPGGSDGGCFASALASVRRCGGVLEHPAYSHAWERHGLQRPQLGPWQQSAAREWVCEVHQGVYGHRARKATWLLYCGGQAPPQLIWDAATGSTHQCGYKFGGDRAKPTVGKREASATPPDFVDALVELALHSTKPAPPADWWARALPDYAARGGFAPILIDPPEEEPPGLERVTHAEVVALRGAP